ncbi:PoNe immunity protein domain-containing protein [Methylomonas sp. 2BW1-5-20]|uniref:PoNe immunity protein domain-containing protein n=1 Tax=Methylomonas sp. 2BW1-5-20 TaxID=3376686 RepID=UPI00404F9634
MSEEYFFERNAYLEKRIPEMEQKLAASNAPLQKKMTYQYSLFRETYQHLLIRYSLGDDFLKLDVYFGRILSALEKYRNIAVEVAKPGQYTFPKFSELEDYVVSMWLISLAIALNVDETKFIRLINCIGNIGKDALFERLVATRVKSRPIASTLVFPEIYQSLYEAIDATEPERSKLVCQFLTGWYENMKPTYWYDCHKGPEGGGFFGYWALEVAGVVKAFDIDDSAFCDFAHYPGFN